VLYVCVCVRRVRCDLMMFLRRWSKWIFLVVERPSESEKVAHECEKTHVAAQIKLLTLNC